MLDVKYDSVIALYMTGIVTFANALQYMDVNKFLFLVPLFTNALMEWMKQCKNGLENEEVNRMNRPRNGRIWLMSKIYRENRISKNFKILSMIKTKPEPKRCSARPKVMNCRILTFGSEPTK